MSSTRPRVDHHRFARGGRVTPWPAADVPQAMLALGGGRTPLVPLIGSGVAGPLGLVHLPRMWLDVAAIGQVNNAIRKAHDAQESLLLRDDERAWDAIHAQVVRGGPHEPIVPAIGSRRAGRLTVDHLPRLWLKALLLSVGALPYGYRSAAPELDRSALANQHARRQ